MANYMLNFNHTWHIVSKGDGQHFGKLGCHGNDGVSLQLIKAAFAALWAFVEYLNYFIVMYFTARTFCLYHSYAIWAKQSNCDFSGIANVPYSIVL